LRMMFYWAQQMQHGTEGVEAYALAELELHRVIADASHNPLLTSISAIVEFAITVALDPDQPPPRSGTHLALIDAIQSGDAFEADLNLVHIVNDERERGMRRLAPS
jgi:DNA-binding FadR family transcriptional regulator